LVSFVGLVVLLPAHERSTEEVPTLRVGRICGGPEVLLVSVGVDDNEAFKARSPASRLLVRY
jgi:hypothetical protein